MYIKDIQMTWNVFYTKFPFLIHASKCFMCIITILNTSGVLTHVYKFTKICRFRPLRFYRDIEEVLEYYSPIMVGSNFLRTMTLSTYWMLPKS